MGNNDMIDNAKKTSNLTPAKPSWYSRWHEEGHHVLIHWIIFLLIVCLFGIVLNTQITEWFTTVTNQANSLNTAKQSVDMSLDPETKSVKVGETFSVNVTLDTSDKPVDGIDIYSLHYDPKLLKVIDFDPTQKGVQIEPGTLMELNSGNIVDEISGAIKFSQLAAGGTSFTGKGTVATVNFRALAKGTSKLNIDFARGKTVDSNAPYRGKDQLGSVGGSVITIE